jgi:hypothetical protein
MVSSFKSHRNVGYSQSYLTTDGQSASLSWCQVNFRARDQFFFLLEIFCRQLQVCYFVAPSLTRGRVCNLLLLLVLAIAVPLWCESLGTQDHILLSQFLRLPQPGDPGPRIYIPQEQGDPVIPTDTGFPFRRLLRLARLRRRYSNPPPHVNVGYICLCLARRSVVVKALCYKPEGRGFDTRLGEFLNLPNPSVRTRPWGLLSL